VAAILPNSPSPLSTPAPGSYRVSWSPTPYEDSKENNIRKGNEKTILPNMRFFDVPLRKQELILLAVIYTVLIVPLWVFGSKPQGMENLCPQYILISTALMSIIFAAMAIKNDRETISRLVYPLMISSTALGSSTFTFFMIQMNFSSSVIIRLLFSLATLSLFTAIFELNVLTYRLYTQIKKPKPE
jgi:hypothetical protein